MDFSVDNFLTLGMLIVLQAVLGFDNLLYISLESKNAPQEKQQYVRTVGIVIAIALRIGLLFLLVKTLQYMQTPFLNINWTGKIEAHFNTHSLIVLIGGIFIIYTAIKEIWHMISLEEHDESADKKKKSTSKVIFMIVLMNVIFSIDSILSAKSLTDELWVMVAAIIISGIMMIWLSDRVSNFLAKNRMYEVLGLFILFIVGIMLLTEGAHIAHLHLWGTPIQQMPKAEFYFIIAILVLIDIVQGRYQKKLMRQKEKNRAQS